MTWTLAEHVGGAGKASVELPEPLLAGADDPSLYDADDDLLTAATVAIRLGQPLLLTGEPGCGKTAFADHLAWRLGRRRGALKVHGRSNMERRDLFYTYDDVGRFRDRESRDPADYLTLEGLGEAILRGSEPERTADLRERLLKGDDGGPADDARKQSGEVVLFDEIDKAPRDVPNDLLSLLTFEHISFPIPELNVPGRPPVRIRAGGAFRPVIVITSNSERSLPDAFLRRCAYHHIGPLEGERLHAIVENRVFGMRRGSALMASVERLYQHLRAAKLNKTPGLAELIGFAKALVEGERDVDRALEGDDWQRIAKTLLFKKEDDLKRADALLEAFQSRSSAP